MKKIKVIQLSHASHSYFLGDKRELKEIIINDWNAQTARQIKKYHPEIEIECWTPEKLNKKEEEFMDSGIKYRIFPVTFSPIYALDFSLEMIKALKKEINENKQKGMETIIHLHEYHNLHGLLIASLFGKEKIIAQHHGGSWPVKHISQTRRYNLVFPLFFLAQIWENLVLKNIKVFYALSSDEIDYLKKITNSEIRFQTMGIEEECFKKINRATARKKLKLPLDKKIILYIGRINEVKGIRYLIDSMEKLPEIDLKIMGFSQDVEIFKDYATSKKLKNVEFLGGVFGEKKMLYLSAVDALVLPSSKEGAPVTIMEALAKNLPVVATNVGGISMMLNKENGIIISPRNSKEIVSAVKEILTWKNKETRKESEKYKWEKRVNETVKDYLS